MLSPTRKNNLAAEVARLPREAHLVQVHRGPGTDPAEVFLEDSSEGATDAVDFAISKAKHTHTTKDGQVLGFADRTQNTKQPTQHDTLIE